MEQNLISYIRKDTEQLFDHTDNEKSFRKNLKKKKQEDWIYNTKSITYKINSHGFRTSPFSKIDWANSIVVLGCSNVYGVGLAVEDTMCSQLEKILNIPVVNLGIPGSAVDLVCWNSLILHNYYPRPKAVIQIWTGLSRYSDYIQREAWVSYSPRDPGYYNRLNWDMRSQYYIEADRTLWKNKTMYYEGSFFRDTAAMTGVSDLAGDHRARDLLHPGIESNRSAAENIAEELIKQGI